MKLPVVLFALFVALPIVEIYVLVRVGSVIGALPTIALVLGLSAFGAWLVRREGLGVLRRVQAALDAGQLPARELLDGALVLVGGVLLLTPGFVTDAFGLCCLLPPVRAWLIRVLGRHALVVVTRRGTGPGPAADGAPGRGPRTLDGEYRRED